MESAELCIAWDWDWLMRDRQPCATIFTVILVALALTRADATSAQDMGAINATTSSEVLPYARMSESAYNNLWIASDTPGWTRIASWQQIFTAMGRTNLIAPAQASGFYAAVYLNGASNMITIAYRGTEIQNLAQDSTDAHAWSQAKVQDEYRYADELAVLVKKMYPTTQVSVTGHSLGGALATYVGQNVTGISQVVTFNSARPGFLSGATRGGTNQINVIVPGDPVGDPKSKSPWGIGSLPGKSYYVNSTTVTPQSPGATHSLLGIIGSLQNASTVGNAQINAQSSSPTVWGTQQPSAASTSAGVGTPTTVAKPTIVAKPVPSGTAGSAPPNVSLGPTIGHAPGGISLSKAAAESMPLSLDLDGVYYHDGRFVISGQQNTTQTFDAALLFTAFRLACEIGDPYFSLDADNGAAWSEEGERASNDLWPQVSKDVDWGRAVPANRRTVNSRSLAVHNIWARRDYPRLWDTISSKYPNLRSKLVFRPLWLQQTRFGEIMYRADVLIKELASGTSLLQTGPFRAAKVAGYVSELARSNAHSLLAQSQDQKVASEWRGSRFWFDIAPRTNAKYAGPSQNPATVSDRRLFSTLKEHGFISASSPALQKAHEIIRNGDALDLSNVFPTMFVRRHDVSRGVDLPDDDPIMNAFSDDVNEKIEQYTNAYKELQALTKIVRAYVAAIHVLSGNNAICRRLKQLPLLDSEKTPHQLPAYHPSELMISVMRYATGSGRGVNTAFVRATVVQGGVAIAGRAFYSAGTINAGTTRVTRLLSAEILRSPPEAEWKGPEGRQYVSFAIDTDRDAQADRQYNGGPSTGGPHMTVTPPQSSANGSADYDLCVAIHGQIANKPAYCEDGGRRYYRQ